jgi:hypothetical protein
MNTIERALGRYADFAPLDLKRPSEIQNDLQSILGRPHLHDGRGTDKDECFLCCRDIRNEIHSSLKSEKDLSK